MHAAAEREWLHLRAGEVDPVGIRVPGRIAVRGAEEHEDPVTGRDCHIAERDIGRREPAGQLHRAVVAQQLVGDVRRQLGLRSQRVHLFGLGEQRDHAVADQVGRRLEPGEEQQRRSGCSARRS